MIYTWTKFSEAEPRDFATGNACCVNEMKNARDRRDSGEGKSVDRKRGPLALGREAKKKKKTGPAFR